MCNKSKWVLHLFWGRLRSMAGRGGRCTPPEHCFHMWGHLHQWLSLVSHKSLWKTAGGHIDFICFLMRLIPKHFEVHPSAEQSHLPPTNDKSQLRELQISSSQFRVESTEEDCGRYWLFWFRQLKYYQMDNWLNIATIKKKGHGRGSIRMAGFQTQRQ